MKLVFQHIPKCAGSSVHNILLKSFPIDSFHNERFNRLEDYPINELINKNIFSGHFDAWRVGLIPGPKFVFTFLRDPKARIISLYNFWRSHTWDFIDKNELIGPRLAKSISFEEFLQTDNVAIQSNFDNVYTRLALGRAQSLEIEILLRDDSDKAIELAIKYYKSLDFVGITENSETDFSYLCSLLSVKFTGIEYENVGNNTSIVPGREKIDNLVISDAAENLLYQHIQLDLEVYKAFLNESSRGVLTD